MQGTALLRLRQRLRCARLRLWSEVAMVQAGARAGALVGTGRGSGGGSDGGGRGREAGVPQSFAMGGGI